MLVLSVSILPPVLIYKFRLTKHQENCLILVSFCILKNQYCHFCQLFPINYLKSLHREVIFFPFRCRKDFSRELANANLFKLPGAAQQMTDPTLLQIIGNLDQERFQVF